MKLSDLICFDAIVPQLKSADRDGVISELVSSLERTGKLGKAKASVVTKAVIKRENEASTGIGKGVAVPHVKHSAIKDVVATVGCCSGGVDFSSLDKQPVYSVILLLSPEGQPEKHLQAMETIFKNLQKDDFLRFLKQAQTAESVKDVIMEADENGS
jgi:mannitol/fructose-specific phosphotransferase system IIA component (Ntr-type)